MKNNSRIASSFDDFLDEEDLLTQVNEIAIKRVLDWQLQQKITIIEESIDSDKNSNENNLRFYNGCSKG